MSKALFDAIREVKGSALTQADVEKINRALGLSVAPATVDKFSVCLAETLTHEGGWADHPKDPGGATMKGVTLAVYQAFRPGATKADLRKISDEDLKAIYRTGYWDKVRGDDLPAGVDLMTFDVAVNSGPSRAIKWLQEAVGANPDGIMGPVTLAKVNAAEPLAVIDTLNRRRDRFYRSLSTFTTFGTGWLRRLASVTEAAKRMAR